MSTASLTVINDNDGREIAVLYRHHDGYLSGHGMDLAQFLTGKKTVEGYGGDDRGRVFNGPECLAAALVCHFKKEPARTINWSNGWEEIDNPRAGEPMTGNVYLYPAGTRNIGEEYKYTVTARLTVRVSEQQYLMDQATGRTGPVWVQVFEGSPEELREAAVKEREAFLNLT